MGGRYRSMLVDGAPGTAIHPQPTDRAAPAVLARQGIYDPSLRLVAYELLFRPTAAGDGSIGDGDAATAQVVLEAFTNIGLDALVGANRAFINVPYTFLIQGLCEALPPERVVLELLEHVEVDRSVIATARHLVDRGHTLALDDFVYRDGIEPLVELASIVKLDVLALPRTELEQQVELLKPFNVTLLAEKIESADQIERLRAMGFELFQGFALQRPKTVHAPPLDFNEAVLATILTATTRVDISPHELVDTIACDPAIVYALLRITNSAYFSIRQEISSLHQAAALLGVNGIRNWTLMMIMSRVASGQHEILADALIRAKMCELCARDHRIDPATSFTVGLLSTLPALLHQPIEAILEDLALTAELQDALIDHQGPAGRILEWVLTYETHDQDQLATLNAPRGLLTAYLDAVQWTTNVLPELPKNP